MAAIVVKIVLKDVLSMEDEFTEKMHSEFTVDDETDKKHRVGCVWRLIGFEPSKDKLEYWANSYGVSVSDCMKWKSYWENLHQNSRRRGDPKNTR